MQAAIHGYGLMTNKYMPKQIAIDTIELFYLNYLQQIKCMDM